MTGYDDDREPLAEDEEAEEAAVAAEWRRLLYALAFFLVCGAVFVVLVTIGLFH